MSGPFAHNTLGHRSKRYKMRLVDTPGFTEDVDRETARRTLEEYFAFVSVDDTTLVGRIVE